LCCFLTSAVVYFVIDSVRKISDTLSYLKTGHDSFFPHFHNSSIIILPVNAVCSYENVKWSKEERNLFKRTYTEKLVIYQGAHIRDLYVTLQIPYLYDFFIKKHAGGKQRSILSHENVNILIIGKDGDRRKSIEKGQASWRSVIGSIACLDSAYIIGQYLNFSSNIWTSSQSAVQNTDCRPKMMTKKKKKKENSDHEGTL